MTAVNFNRVPFAPAKDGANAVATLGRGQWGDVKVTVSAARRRPDRRYAGKVEENG
jgi:hypothetical protein